MAIDIKFPMIIGGSSGSSFIFGKLSSSISSTTTPAPAMAAQLWVWGNNYNGKLGDNTTVNKSSPVQTIAGGSDWNSVAGGYAHTAGIKTNGTLWTWGDNTFYGMDGGQLGDNTNTNKSSPVQVGVETNWSSVACGNIHTAAIKTDGTLWTWGRGTTGQLGDGAGVISRSSPAQTIAGGTDWSKLACGSYNTAAIKTDGTLWLWGQNYYGQLGINIGIGNKSSPAQTIAGGSDWNKIACGAAHIAAIKTDGTLWIWGSNSNGELGDNTTVNKSSPVQTIVGGSDWNSVACGNSFTAAIKNDGNLFTWGSNIFGRLGNGITVNKSSPTQTIAGGTNWSKIACGNSHAAAIKTDGTLWVWGYSTNGGLGDNTTVSKSSPVQTVAGGTNWIFVACDKYYAGSTYALYS
jgi:alpha-tubulin suppressor-like RCC1 family protein